MSNIKSLATMAAAASLLPAVLGVFDPSSNSNVAVYWGQGPDQKPLSHFCADPNIDIVNIGFLNKFPDQTKGLPGTNFGNQCGPDTFKNKDGSDSPFLKGCENIGADIITCQKAGKKVFLSLGGAIPSDQTVKDDKSAEAFADILWTSFGPKSDATAPRPFGDAVIDGFDFDIESALVKGQDPADLSRGYSSLINALRKYFLFANGQYYISGAPQCIIPDAHLANAIETSYFDFLFVQFYNTPECSARAYFDHNYGGKDTDISFSGWVDFVHTNGLNKKTKVYLGLPASADKNVIYDAKMYLQPNEAKKLIQDLQTKYPLDFGGVMVYEATASENNLVGGKPYLDALKKDLKEGGEQSTSLSASNTKGTSSTKAASSAPLFPTIIPSSLPFGLAPPSSSGAPYPIPSGSAPSSSAPYPIPSGSAPSSGATGSSGVIIPSGSASYKSSTRRYTFTTGTAPYTSKTGTAPYSIETGTASSASASSVPSGVSSGSLPSGSGSSSVPYPTGNSSLPISSGGYAFPATSSGEEVVTSTNVVTLTSCGPKVTNCPAKTHPVVSTETHLSTIHLRSSGSVPSGASSATSITGNSPQSSKEVGTSPSVTAGTGSTPGNSPQTTQEVVTTAIVTSYLTTCPVTSTTTSGGSQVIETGSTVSTVYSTIISTICTKCVAPPTGSGAPGPSDTAIASIPGGGHQGPPLPMPAGPSSSLQETSSSAPVSQSQSPTTATPSPSGTIQEVVTTVIKFTTLTTCPVTHTITSGTSEVIQVTQTVSTITATRISTICTKCVAPPTGAPAPGSGVHAPSSTSVASIPGSGHQGPPVPMPAGPSSGEHTQGSSSQENPVLENSPQEQSPPEKSSPGSSSPAGSAPAGSPPAGSSSPSHGAESGTQGSSTPSNSGSSGSSGSSPASHGSESPAGLNGSPSTPQIPSSPVPSTPAANSPVTSESQSGAQAGKPPAVPASQAPAASPAGSSAAGSQIIQSTGRYHAIKTLTIVPIPVNPSQTALPKKPVESAEEASGVPSEAAPASTPSNSGAQEPGTTGSSAPGSGAPVNSAAEGAPVNSAAEGAPVNSAAEGAPVNSAAEGAPVNSAAQGAPVNSAAEGAPAPAPGNAAPFPANNGTTHASPTGSASPSSGSTKPSLPSIEAFQGAASRVDAGVLGLMSLVVAAVMML